MSLVDERALETRIRAIAREEAARPEYVSQRTVLLVVGMPARDFLHHGRKGAWPVRSDRRLRYAKTADVLAWLEAHHGNEATAREFRRSRSGIRRVA